MTFTRKLAQVLLLATALAAWTSAPAAAQSYPNRTVQIVNPHQAGSHDRRAGARALASGWRAASASSSLIVNRVGRGWRDRHRRRSPAPSRTATR